ncbi:HPr kinase/phosphatase C-terminal domain-containing protein [Leisingera aquaemixtae]|uniref:HPr kinase/phosphorylase n=1 Tax=Leisingera aquaemixtae TaxID=1396826 RepID=UPI001C96A7AF|nr:HPr kinase/phosphatase C-terminal domain-containing protein [Leisingera aquaemixtae]MBY6068615.1 HPr kinase/phosphatase C-terminal domain-containing protein [Leisingera aquaemixtae]
MPETQSLILHASCVALEGRGLLITGTSGQGKSALALQLMAYGAQLVADDRVLLRQMDGQVVASAPEPIRGLVEARFMGLLHAQIRSPVPVALLADLDEAETERLPVRHTTRLLGQEVARVKRVDGAHFAPALMQFLRCGALDPDA